MGAAPDRSDTASCQCGQVVLSIDGPPILHVACYCTSCQQAGRLIERLADALPVLGHDGGTDYLCFRKDHVRCTHGGGRLVEFRLKPGSATRRLVAECCNTAMFADFTKGHWLSLYRGRIAGSVPPLQMRLMTAERREGVVLPNDAPAYRGRTGRMMWPLLKTWAAMGFRIPEVQGVPAQARAIHLGAPDA
jgi:hypothetical protein